MRLIHVSKAAWLVLWLLAISGHASASSHDRIKVRVNKLQGVLDLAVSYCGGLGESLALQALLESAGHRSGEPPKVMVRFCSLDIGQNSIGYPGRPLAYNTGWSSPWQRLLNASVRNADMASFLDETAGAFTFEDQQKIVDAMLYLEPVYDRLVERPIGRKAADLAHSISAYMGAKDVEAMLRSIGNLYAVRWPEGMPLWIGLSPTPPGSAGFTATANGNVVRSFMPVDFDRPDIYTSVVAHEFAHVLYSNMPLERVHAIKGAFGSLDSPGKRFAEAWLNEALATAAGNGWVYRELNGVEDQGDWYSDTVVDPYAKAISGLVYDALDSGNPIDPAMVPGFVAGFDKAHPDALRNPDVLLPHAAIVSNVDAGTLDAMRSAYAQRIGIRRLDAMAPGGADDGERLPVVLHVEIVDRSGPGVDWHRQLRDDGGIDFSARLGNATAFGDALDALILRIRADDWPD